MTDDWADNALLEGFPRKGTVYFLNFIEEPKTITRRGDRGDYQKTEVNLQLFALNPEGGFSYLGPVKKELFPCAIEFVLLFRHLMFEYTWEVVGIEHRRHVDLELSTQFSKEGMHTKAHASPGPVTAAVDVVTEGKVPTVQQASQEAGGVQPVKWVDPYPPDIGTPPPAAPSMLTPEGQEFIDKTLAAIPDCKQPCGHPLLDRTRVGGTLSTAGNTDFYKCSICGKLYEEAEP